MLTGDVDDDHHRDENHNVLHINLCRLRFGDDRSFIVGHGVQTPTSILDRRSRLHRLGRRCRRAIESILHPSIQHLSVYNI
jgi:hypothetical protein